MSFWTNVKNSVKGFVEDVNHQALRYSGSFVDGLLGTNFVGNYDAAKNFDLQKRNLQYQYGLQQQIFDREDSSVARRAADLQAAGINPLMAAGSSANSGAVVSTSAPQRDTPKWSTLDHIATVLSFDKLKADIAKTDAETAVQFAQLDNLRETNRILGLNGDKLEHDLDIINDTPGMPSDTPAIIRFISSKYGYAKNLFSEWYDNYTKLRNNGHSILKSAGVR